MGQAQTCGGVKLVNGIKRKLNNYLIVEGALIILKKGLKIPNKSVIRSRKLKMNTQHNGQKKKNKGQTTIYKTLHRKLNIDQHEPHKKTALNLGAPEVLGVPPLLVKLVMLLLNHMIIM